jgi:hypothetical protein
MDRAERLRRRNAKIYEWGQRRRRALLTDEHGNPSPWGVFCGSCQRELEYAYQKCSCDTVRRWKDWERNHDPLAFKRLLDVGLFPPDSRKYTRRRAAWLNLWRRGMIEYLERTAKGKFADILPEYIREFEHQEGNDGWWVYFSSPQEALEDLYIYRTEIGDL